MFLVDNLGSVTSGLSGETMNKDKLVRAVGTRAAALRKSGVSRGSVVLLTHGGTPSFFADLFASWQAGATVACLNPGLTGPELANISSFLKADAALVTDGQEVDVDLGMTRVMNLDALASTETYSRDNTSALDDIALLLFTSGTTGTPKGVAHTFRSILGRITLNQSHIPLDELDVVLCPLPTHFGHGLIGNCLTAMLAGRPIVLVPGGSLKTASSLGALIDQYRISFMSSVPALWKLAVKASKRPQGGTLRRIHVGSAPLSADLWGQIIEWSGTRNVVNMYGITETANWISGASAAEVEPADGLIGRMWGGHAAVLGQDGVIRSYGSGELLVQTPTLMHSYHLRPDLTQKVLRGGWFHTGDIGRIDVDGMMRLTGRSKYEINRAGMKIYPEDIDILLERHPGIREACAFGMKDDVAGEIVAVAIVSTDLQSRDLPTLKEWVGQHLAREKIPERWFFIDEIPKTDRGKINRATVAAACLNLRGYR